MYVSRNRSVSNSIGFFRPTKVEVVVSNLLSQFINDLS